MIDHRWPVRRLLAWEGGGFRCGCKGDGGQFWRGSIGGFGGECILYVYTPLKREE